MKYTFLSFLMLICITASIAQTSKATYDIAVDGVTVGSLTAAKEIDADKTTITIDSNSSVHFLGTTTVTTSFVSILRNGQLESSTYTSQKDGNPYDSCVITESNGVYSINRKGKKSTITTPIKNVTGELYFEEPNDGESYFDVLGAVFNPIVKTSSNTFAYNDAASSEKTTYTYVNGKLQQGATAYTLYKYTFTRKE